MALTPKTTLSGLNIGDYVWCKYNAPTSGQVGSFSDIATKTDADVVGTEIPVASSATPNGYFKLIKVGIDFLSRDILVADRNVQHSIAWDVLNTVGVASGSGLPTRTVAYTPNLIPVMTSNTAPSGQAFSSQVEGAANYPWQAFDGSTTTQWGGNTVTLPAYLGYKFVSAKKITAYTLMCNGSYYPTNWTFEGSNDGVNYTILHTITNASGFLDNPAKKIFTFNNNISYLYYRINVTSAISNYPNIFQLEIMESAIANPDGYAFTTRLLTGATVSTDKDNEWDNYIVNSTLGGTITAAGDNAVWNWNQIQGMTSTTASGGAATRTLRGFNTVGEYLSAASSSVSTARGFRPVFIIETLSITKFLFEDAGQVKTFVSSNWNNVGASPVTKTMFETNGLNDLALFTRKSTLFSQNMLDNGALGAGKTFKSSVDLRRFIELLGLNTR